MAVRLNTKLSGANAIKKWNDKVGSASLPSNPTQKGNVQTGVVNRANSNVFGGLKNGNISSAASAAGRAMDNIRNAARGWSLNNSGGGNGISRSGSGNGIAGSSNQNGISASASGGFSKLPRSVETPSVSKLPYTAGDTKITKLSTKYSDLPTRDEILPINADMYDLYLHPDRTTINLGDGPIRLTRVDVAGPDTITANGKIYRVERGNFSNGSGLDNNSEQIVDVGSEQQTADVGSEQQTADVGNSYMTDNGNRAFKTDEDVVVTDYLKSRPDSSVRWDASSGDLYVNGYRVPKNEVYLSPEGKSFVNRSTLDSIYRQTVESDPLSAYSVMKNFNDSQADLKSYLEEARNPQKFSYDPEKDKMFKYYSDYYDMLADRAVDDALGQLMGRTGGYVNSNALAAAYQARNNFMQQKANIIPTLEQNAYERFASDRDSYNNNITTALQNIANNNIAYADALNALRTGWNDNQNAALDRDLERDRFESDSNYNNRMLDAQITNWDRQGDQTDRELDIKQQQVDNDYDVGLINKGYVKNEDGSFSPIAPVAVPVASSGSSSSGKSTSSGSSKNSSEDKQKSSGKSSGSSKSSGGGKSSTLIPIV